MRRGLMTCSAVWRSGGGSGGTWPGWWRPGAGTRRRPGRAGHFAKGKNEPGFGTKLAMGADLAVRAREAGFPFRVVVADSAYGDQDGFRAELAEAGLPFVMALRPRRGTWARAADVHTPVEAARALAWDGPDDPGGWPAVRGQFRAGQAGTRGGAGAH